jgi:hypothetical protein
LQSAELVSICVPAEALTPVVVSDDFSNLMLGNASVLERGDGRTPKAVEVETIAASDLVDVNKAQAAAILC